VNTSRIKTIAAPVFAVVALTLAASATAAIGPNDRAGSHGVSAGYVTDAYGAPAVISVAPPTVRPDDLAGIHAVGTGYMTDAYGAPPAISVAPPTSGGSTGTVATARSESKDDGFDWSSAGAGVATALGLAMLLGAAALVVRRTRVRMAT
jgi:hypothetical protein